MHVITATNVNDALSTGLYHLKLTGIEEHSRNGRVLVAPHPVCTIYKNPMERVLFNQLRDANPFFHFMESLWMLGGCNDVEFPAYYAANIANFSDDGETLNGAYGFRWRAHFGYDQIAVIVSELKANPKTRRAVLSMWDGGRFDAKEVEESGGTQIDYPGDLALALEGSKDVPCNTHVYFDTVGGKLNMTVCCRSNDAVWGAYGANAVHFSFLLEYVALCAGLPVGEYRQISNNFHVYSTRPDVVKLMDASPIAVDDLYHYVRPASLILSVETMEEWNSDLAVFLGNWAPSGREFSPDEFETLFFRKTVVPMYKAYALYKQDNLTSAMHVASTIAAEDWCSACQKWLERRILNRAVKQGALQ